MRNHQITYWNVAEFDKHGQFTRFMLGASVHSKIEADMWCKKYIEDQPRVNANRAKLGNPPLETTFRVMSTKQLWHLS